jgi:tetratricopeptide (TPR) repeat protein
MDPLKISAIGDKAVTAVQNYIDDCISLKSDIRKNDTIPVFDGDILVYGKNRTISLDNYIGPVRVQVKGSTDSTYFFSIGRKHIEVYENTGGCIFFKVLEEELPSGKFRVQKILYKIINVDVIKGLLQQNKDSIRIDLKELPVDNSVFEEEVSRFVQSIKGEKIDNPAPEEIKALVEEYKEMEKYLDEIEDQDTRFELESQIQTIKSLTNDGTVIWRNKFIYHSRKALDLAINNLKDYDLAAIHHNFGKYLYDQKQYHLVEYYYLKALEEYRKREDNVNIANTLNNLGELHRVVTRYEDAEVELQEALDLRCKLAKAIRNPYVNNLADTFKNLADTSNNLAVLHATLNKHEKAEKEWKGALEIYRVLITMNRLAYTENAAMTLNNLAILHNKLNCNAKAEEEYQEALELYRELANTNYDVYIADVAMTLNNLAILHMTLTCNEKAEEEYQEALKIRRELAKTNREAHIGDVAMILNNLAIVHKNLSRYEEAELEYKEALEIRRELAKTNRDAYIEQVANTLLNLALLLYIDETRLDEARNAANEALGIYKELAKKYPQIWSKDVEKTQRLLDELNDVEK